MCVIVHQPAGAYLSKQTAEKMWETNSDGGGFAYIGIDQKIHVEKFLDFADFWRSFEEARSTNRDTDFLVHMRIATSGRVALDNCHPFQVDEHTVMAHNGILTHITGSIPLAAEKSDTREFVELVLPELPKNWLDNDIIVDMVEDYIGSSKLMFLTTNPELKKNVYILNESKGVNKHKMWWSNSNHEKTYVYSSGKGKKEVSKVYQLPLPRDGKGSEDCEPWWESDDSYAKWWADQNKETLKDIDNDKDLRKAVYKVLNEEEAVEAAYDLSYSEIMEERKMIGLGMIDIDYNVELDCFICSMCESPVSETTADCACWDMMCIDCGALAPYCIHAPEDATLVSFKEASEYYEQKRKENA